MIYQKIFITEQRIKSDIRNDKKKLEALGRIKNLLGKVDNSVELIPASDLDKLYSLLSDLKGSELNNYEKLMLREIAKT